MSPIPNGFRDRAILLYGSKIVDKKELLNSTGDINARCNSCEDMAFFCLACLYSVKCTYCTVK
jgi:hypothetical protein